MKVYSQFGHLIKTRYPYYDPPSTSLFWQRDTRGTGTHVETLADNTPKSRRRCRRLLAWAPNKGSAWPIRGRESDAQAVARQRETHSATAFAAKRRATT